MTHLHLLLHIVTLNTEALVVPWHQFIYSLLVPDGRLAIQPVHESVLQVLIICMSFTSKVRLHLQEEVKVRWCQVRTVWRTVECVPKLNNCACCMRKLSLLSRCPTYLKARVKFLHQFPGSFVRFGQTSLKELPAKKNLIAWLRVSWKSEQCFCQRRKEISVHTSHICCPNLLKFSVKRPTRSNVEDFPEGVIREGRTLLVGCNDIATAPLPWK